MIPPTKVPMADVLERLEEEAPLSGAEDWDNVGLLIGDREREIASIMTCLTLTEDVVEEACQEGADLIVTHHPLPFRPLSRITSETSEGTRLLRLMENRIAVYSAHTAWDSAKNGINARLAKGLQLQDVSAIVPSENGLGSGRYGTLPTTIRVRDLRDRLAGFLNVTAIPMVGNPNGDVSKVAVACGSAAEFLDKARELGCEAFVTGEASFHRYLDARAVRIALLLPGHYASERFGMDALAETLSGSLPATVRVWASTVEKDPILDIAPGLSPDT